MFRYYITDTCNGCIVGTNDGTIAQNFAGCEDYFVVDTLTGRWWTESGPQEIKEGHSDDQYANG